MALQPCRECGREISTEAIACPQCGAPQPIATRPSAEIESGPAKKGSGCVLVVFIALAIGIIGFIAIGVFADPHSDAQLIGHAESLIERNLKDPGSAQFSNVRVIRRPVKDPHLQDVAVCGQVNARNSFGGLAGNSRFVVDLNLRQSDKGVQTMGFSIEDADKRATVKSRDSADGPWATIFEEIYWNPHCTDEVHPATFTADTPKRW